MLEMVNSTVIKNAFLKFLVYDLYDPKKLRSALLLKYNHIG